jgi:apolipoprotein N-acyltransferase
VALTPLLVALAKPSVSGPTRDRHAFVLGLVTGLAYFAGTVYWTSDVMAVYGGLNRVTSMLVALLLIAYMALYPAFFALLMAWLTRRVGCVGLLAAPAAWVASELARGRLFAGFPWVLLGYSQSDVLPIAQAASVTGVYGISALVVATGAALAYWICMKQARSLVAFGVTVGLALVVGMWGAARIATGEWAAEGSALQVGIVQGNVPQDHKWDETFAHEIFDVHLALTRAAAASGAQLIVWPESSTPFVFEEDPVRSEQLRGLARTLNVSLLVGSEDVVREPVGPPRIYNAAFAIGPDGRTVGVYRKVHLVPFGEYVPLSQLLFFARPLVERVGEFSAGDAVTLLPVAGVRASTAICYEIIFPELVREGVSRGSELLTTITNDAWFGPSSAPYQHFEQARLRAVEQGRYLVRAANTGVSGIVDPYGRVLAQTPIFERQMVVGQVRAIRDRTIYSRVGDAFAWACALATAVVAGAAWRQGTRRL